MSGGTYSGYTYVYLYIQPTYICSQSSYSKLFNFSSLDYTVNVGSGISNKYTGTSTVTSNIGTPCLIQGCSFYSY